MHALHHALRAELARGGEYAAVSCSTCIYRRMRICTVWGHIYIVLWPEYFALSRSTCIYRSMRIYTAWGHIYIVLWREYSALSRSTCIHRSMRTQIVLRTRVVVVQEYFALSRSTFIYRSMRTLDIVVYIVCGRYRYAGYISSCHILLYIWRRPHTTLTCFS